MTVDEEEFVNGLWIGSQLSSLERLCPVSFLRHGHAFRLWTYGELTTSLPPGVVVEDANRILDRQRVFRYRRGPHQGSLAGFSDIFRAKLLHDVGGWYVDMDATCLGPLDATAPYVFRPHHNNLVVGNIMKAPRGSPALRQAFEASQERVTADNTDWELPLAILSDCVRDHGLARYVQPDLANQDLMEDIQPRVYMRARFHPTWRVFHWCNEYLRDLGFPKDRPPYWSRLRDTYVEHGLRPRPPTVRVTGDACRYRWARSAGPARLAAFRARWRRRRPGRP